ncbi:sulfate transporter-like [Ambystoma mexicanum]|uniref:sulfate transporter-like n=1 Tax=Ambystoma mexicanum TaxID=8296 RepID=UPI0037E76A84
MESREEGFSEHDRSMSFISRKTSVYAPIHLEEHEHSKPSTMEEIHQKAKEICTCTPKTILKCLLKLCPLLKWGPRYKFKEYLLGDIVSGLIIGMITIPQTIAYSLLANQDPIYGLYTNFFCFLIYIAFATSRHNCVGADGVLCLMIGEVVSKQLTAAGYSTGVSPGAGSLTNSSLLVNDTVFCDKSCYAITVATSLTFLVGVYQITFWIFKLDFISVYLSEPLLSGFVTGSSLTILTSQVKYLFGLSLPSRNGAGALVLTWIDIFTYIEKTNICDLITSIVAMVIIIPVKEINDWFKNKIKVPIPVEFVVLIVATLVSHYFNFKVTYKSSICGTIPTGFLSPRPPDVSLIPSLAADAFPIAVISFALTISLAEIFGTKHGYPVRASQEMLAVGICNFVISFLHSFTSCAAIAKTILRDSTGAKTQASGAISSLVLLLVLLVIAPLFYSLPICILGVIIITNLRGALRKFSEIPNMWHLSKIDTVIWWVSMLSSFLITVQIGLLVAVCFSILCVVFRTQRPRVTLLAKVGGTEIYEDQSTYKELSDIPNVNIFRFETSLYYANKSYFKSMLHKKTKVNPVLVAALHRKSTRIAQEAASGSTDFGFLSRFNFARRSRTSQNPTLHPTPNIAMHSLIIDCGAMQFIDTVGLSMLKETHHDYEEIGVHVLLANCNPDVRCSLREGGYLAQCRTGHGPHQLVFHSIHDAVLYAETMYKEKQRETQLISTASSSNTSLFNTEDSGVLTKL